MSKTRHKLTRHDVAEIAVGASIMAIPVGMAGETWGLGVELPIINIVLIALASYALIAWFVYYLFYEGSLEGHWREFLKRVVTVYVLTLVISSLILLAIDKWPLLSDPILAMKRAVLVSCPASFAATVLDHLN